MLLFIPIFCTDFHSTLLCSYLFTYSMVQSPSWEADWFAASQEIPRISRNPKVHYRTHKRPLPISILGQPNPVHTPTSHLLEIHPNIIHPSTPRSPQWSLSLQFPNQEPIHPPPHPYAPHAQPISFFSILSFYSSNLLPLSLCPCPLLHYLILVCQLCTWYFYHVTGLGYDFPLLLFMFWIICLLIKYSIFPFLLPTLLRRVFSRVSLSHLLQFLLSW